MNADLANKLTRVGRKQTLKLTHYGRKSGKPYQVTTWFIVAGDKVFLSTANIQRQWVRNVLKTPRVQLTIAGETYDGQARFLADPAEHERVMRMVLRKYWFVAPFMLLWRLAQRAGLLVDRTGSFEVTPAAANRIASADSVDGA
ncbi:MAG TPA: nitroreductase family deazaflavin-dependent oxidoreductase [Methylomirabilota bacterium]|nr:nitroreductase family deazaflavin-dependent oxidoreductase [Methylomirabilota bacterium]